MNRLARAPRLVSVLLAAAALSACSGGGGDGGSGGTTNPPTTGTISGQVSAGGNGVAGATIAVTGGASTQSNASGAFTFANVNPGTYTLTVTPPAGFSLGAELASKSVTVQAGAVASVSWALQGAANPGGRQDIHIGGASFTPDNVQISAGTTVRWINDGNVAHTITPDAAGQAGAWASTNITTAGQTFEHTFNTSGTYNYHCNVHAGMSAVIRVQ